MISEAEKKYKKWSLVLSIFIPVAVAALFGIRVDIGDMSCLPVIYASVNGLTALVLIMALVFIKKKNIKLHKLCIHTAIVLSCSFLVMYILYHISTDTTEYGGTLGMVYYPLLIAHIVLSVAVIPFVLITYTRAKFNHIEEHRKIAKITWPLWVFVAISGVVVYLMISPFYGL